ncbi:hypothetical protein KFK09_018202 [Dendrobium nobile]|uniref:Mechanosensitive ion channel MscS domain-containing protein n=1 Tax=Dendrobium nobile TaxID=94219 RepID=A0A8T3AVA8_DENNO|nr:hypothetical protein KFK09_018202 [Dendrobium nobile]
MSRARTVFQICLHAVNRHDSCTGSSQLHMHSMNISKLRWNCFQTALFLNEGKNQKAKTLTLHHSVEETTALFPFSFHEIKQRRNSFSKKNYSRSLNLQNRFLPWGSQFCCRSYSSDASSKANGLQTATQNDFAKETAEKITNSEWSDILNDAHQSVVGAFSYVGRRAKEVSDEVSPYMQQLYYSHPYLEKVIVPVGGTMAATLLAWFIMPRIFRKFHKYASRNPLALLSGGSTVEEIPYEKSVWSALEDPARYLITFMAFYELGIIIAPTTAQYLPQAWRGAVVLSLVWFLHRWKTNVFTRAMEKPSAVGLDRDKLLTLEKISSMGLLVLGAIALAEACGVAVQSILTVGGIGGVATAFAARDILGNILSGLSLQFSKPFSLGDYIKAGSIEGQVVEMGLTTTCLMNPEKFPVIVPNSLFSSQPLI